MRCSPNSKTGSGEVASLLWDGASCMGWSGEGEVLEGMSEIELLRQKSS